jgi:hypothetical protein
MRMLEMIGLKSNGYIFSIGIANKCQLIPREIVDNTRAGKLTLSVIGE